jgi:type I restriction enzyme S subunit
MKSLDSVLERIEYGTSRPTSPDGTRPIVGMKSLVAGRILTEDLARVRDDASLSKLLLSRGDVLLNRTNSPALVGKVGIVDSETDAVFASYLVRLVPDLAAIDPQYLFACLDSETMQARVRSLATRAVSQANVNPTVLRRSLLIPLPPLPQQRRIADILRAWDDAIAAIVQLADARKRSASAEVRRLIARPDAARRPLASIMRPVTARNTVGEERVLTSSAKHGLVDQSRYFGKRIASTDLSGYFLLHRDEFAYNRSSSIGSPFGAIRRLVDHDRGAISTLNLCFAAHDPTTTLPAYLDHLFQSGYLDDQLISIAHEGARAHGLLNVSKSEFFELFVPIPPVPEQTRIAGALDAMQEEIALLDRQLGLLREQKRGLAEKLLSGTIRVEAAAEEDSDA